MSSCFALSGKEEDNDSLIVKLATETSLVPLYLVPLDGQSSDLEEAYLRQLEKVLAFDLHHNGSSFVVKQTDAFNQLGKGSLQEYREIDKWAKENIHYVVKVEMQGRSLKALMLDVQKKVCKRSEGLDLTGELAEDRRQMHQLADRIHYALFGTEGIASTRLLYTVKTQTASDSRKWMSEVWECDYDGANARQLTNERSCCVTPVYLPPKSGYKTGGFFYVSYQLGQPKIYLSSLKEGKKTRLSSLKGNQLMPAVSRQRDKVAFICDITGNPDLFLQMFSPETGPVGKPQQIFSAPQATQGSPSFSPDGGRIAFVSNKDGSPKIYVMEIPAPGTNFKEVKATLISKRNRENSAPAWSPDGKKIAYCARGSGDRQIWMYDFETHQEKQVTQGAGHKENPSWAPNSLHLVFNSSDPKHPSQLYFIHLNALEAVSITSGQGSKQFPNWEPRAID